MAARFKVTDEFYDYLIKFCQEPKLIAEFAKDLDASNSVVNKHVLHLVKKKKIARILDTSVYWIRYKYQAIEGSNLPDIPKPQKTLSESSLLDAEEFTYTPDGIVRELEVQNKYLSIINHKGEALNFVVKGINHVKGFDGYHTKGSTHIDRNAPSGSTLSNAI